jgi:thymidylate synthase
MKMKRWKAIVNDSCSFDVVARSHEAAVAAAVNIAALLFLNHGIALRVQMVVEA